jgi:hypothetical protein
MNVSDWFAVITLAHVANARATQGADASALFSYAAPLFGVVDMRADS